MKGRVSLGLLVTVALCIAGALGAEEPVVAETFASPNGARRVDALYFLRGSGTEIRIRLFSKDHLQRRRVLPADWDARYIRASWSPSSRAVLIGEGYKPEMNLTLYRLVRHRWLATHFALGDRMDKQSEKELPERPELLSSAPVAGVKWTTVRWRSATHCTMVYFVHGLGYEGEAGVTVDCSHGHPSLNTSRFHPVDRVERSDRD